MPSPVFARVSLGVVIPAFEEESRLPRSLCALTEWMDAVAAHIDVRVWIVVEPGRDATDQIVRTIAATDARFTGVFPARHRGKGAAVRAGLEAAEGDWLLFMDADLSTDLEAVSRGLDCLRADPSIQLLIGSRQHAQSQVPRPQSRLRESCGKSFNRILRLLGIAPFADTQCGFKFISRPAARHLVPLMRTDGFAFDVELLLLAQHHGFTVHDFPVIWRNNSTSKVRIVRDSLAMLFAVVKIRIRLNTGKLEHRPSA
jgi:dolichyl-phosphate beta-glucosyltransferase